ncbi:uncharacterized protein EDB91DRAFT_504891 [Suillus paluster]|uniref:uncharacterized protein n=1 Tax=Suillus paluster TaxID=48578 RepID=UPI001B886B78|nr:uncharacterized protein EDB91DRAFT_504891 [Suillus paluster]KAG1736418.1 hypothetical protein EDB91DRAFT_504891 [Suillus paluster]
MPAPVAVYVVAAIASVAAVLAFKEFVFEPHIAPAIERWVDERRARANERARRRGPVPVPATRRSGDGEPGPSGVAPRKRTSVTQGDSIELDGLNLDEWRNDVHRTATSTGLRRRGRVIPDTDEGSISTTIDEVCLPLSIVLYPSEC